MQPGSVVAVHRSVNHSFSKQTCDRVMLLAGLGVEGDVHCGALVRHRYLVKRDPTQPNLTQVHLLEMERLEELCDEGFVLAPGLMGENVTTSGLRLLDLPLGTRLWLGPSAIVELTGLRTPCFQMDKFQQGLMGACVAKVSGKTIYKAGVMGIVLATGVVTAGDAVRVALPGGKHRELSPV